MTTNTMRVLFMNVCVLVVVIAVIQATEMGHNAVVRTPVPGRQFVKTVEGKDFMLDLMKMNFDHSLKNLYTSMQYGSQYMERPGMAKYLRETSDSEWEAGLDVLKKYMQRGGDIQNFRNKLNVAGQGAVDTSGYASRSNQYQLTLAALFGDSHDKFNLMNDIHYKATGATTEGDYDIGHYLDDKLSKETERMYELKNHVITFNKMKTLGVAARAFDSSL